MAVERINTVINKFFITRLILKIIFMKKIILGIAVLAIAGVVALNVNLGTKKSGEVSLLALANIEALANDENGGISWICSTYTSDVYEVTQECYDHGTVTASIWSTRSCNNGLISMCYPGYIIQYYDCEGNPSNTVDMTSQSSC
jgi:hypothetical protein